MSAPSTLEGEGWGEGVFQSETLPDEYVTIHGEKIASIRRIAESASGGALGQIIERFLS